MYVPENTQYKGNCPEVNEACIRCSKNMLLVSLKKPNVCGFLVVNFLLPTRFQHRAYPKQGYTIRKMEKT
jgi:hypothetical protein